MEAHQVQQLKVFEEAVLDPALGRVEAGGTYTEKAVAAANLYEAFMWIDIGAQNQIYSVDGVSVLLERLSPVLFQDFDTFTAWHLMSRTHQVLLTWRSLGRYPKSNFPIHSKEADEEVIKRFGVSVLALGQFISDAPAQATVSSLVFADNSRWQLLLKQPPLSNAILDSFDGGYDPWLLGYQNLVYAGCFNVIRHLELLLNIFEDTLSVTLSSPDLVPLRLQIAEAHEWRFSFRNEIYKHRFETIMHAIGNLVTKELCDFKIDMKSSDFNAYVNDLIKRWIALTSPNTIQLGA